MVIGFCQRIEKLPHSFKMHSSMCLDLKNLIDGIMRIFPDIEDARPGCSSGIQTLCLLNNALEKAKRLLKYCSESSKLYMAVTGDDILSKACRIVKALEQSLNDIRDMVPTVLAIKISQVVQNLRSTVLTLESSEEEAGKAVRELMRRSTSSSVSSDEIRDFHSAALKLQLSTPEAILMERRSLNSLLEKLSTCEVNKKQILKYFLCLLEKHERVVCKDHKESSSPQLQSVNDSVCASTAESGNVTTDSSQGKVEIEPLFELTNLPLDAQVKLIEDVRSRFEHNTWAFRFMSPSRFLEPLITYLKNAHERNDTKGDIKGGMDLLLVFLSGNMRAIESLEEDDFKTFSVFLGSEVVAEEALNVIEVLSNHPHCLSKITSSGSLSSLLKIAHSGPEHLQEQAMTTLKNLSSGKEICLEMVSLDFIQKLTSFLQQMFFRTHSIIILSNLCKNEKGRVCMTKTPGCIASIAELLESDAPEEQENAISILLRLCVQKTEYCYLVVREGVEIYSSLMLISNNGTEEAKVGASELLRALGEVESPRPEKEAEATTSQVDTAVTHLEHIITTPSLKKSGLFGFSLLKKKKSM